MKTSRHLRVFPVGTVLVAAKDMFMDYSGEQWLTKGKAYKIIAPPSFYKYPIEIVDDKGIAHCCSLSPFSHVKNTNQ